MSLAVKGLNRDGSPYKLGLSLYFRFVCHPICSSSALTHESFDLVKFIQKSGSSLGLVLDKRYHSSTHLLAHGGKPASVRRRRLANTSSCPHSEGKYFYKITDVIKKRRVCMDSARIHVKVTSIKQLNSVLFTCRSLTLEVLVITD